MNALRWIGQQLFPLAVIIWINGLIVRVSVRDSVDLMSALYYATPWPVLAALTLPIIWAFRRQPQVVFGGIIFAHLLIGMWLMEDWRSGQPSRDPADLKVVQWNVARPSGRFDGIAKALRGHDADIYAIAEPLPHSGKGADRWRDAFADYRAEFAPGGLLCFVRGEVSSRKTGEVGTACYYALYEARVKGRDLRVLQVDLNGVPSFSRREPLRRLAEMADGLRDRPLIIAGDFNTPRDSVHYRPLRQNFVDCFEKVGIGSGETWPMPLPVLSLDQVWVGGGLVPVRCHHGNSFRSDHRAVITELRFTGQ